MSVAAWKTLRHAPWFAPTVLSIGWVTAGLGSGMLEALALAPRTGFRLRHGLPLIGVAWIPVTLVATGLARKLPWDRRRPVPFLVVHGVAAVATSFFVNATFFAMALGLGLTEVEAVVPGTIQGAIRWLHLNAAGYVATVAAVLFLDRGPASPRPTLSVPRGRGGLDLPLDEIDWLEADGDYVRVHSGERSYLISERMKALDARLDPRFVRVHRSAIVNASRVREVRHRSHGDFEALLADGTVVRVSRSRRERLFEQLEAQRG